MRRAADGSGAEYTPEEIEFLRAIDRYKRTRGRPHPSWQEVLAVLYALGYRKVAEPTGLPRFSGHSDWGQGGKGKK